MLKDNYNLEEALESYLRLLDRERYFDAHEVLEEVWHLLRKVEHPLKNLTKGLINGAICFEHLKRDRYDSKRKALTVLKSYERHKHLCVEGIDHFRLFLSACSKIESLKKVEIYNSSRTIKS